MPVRTTRRPHEVDRSEAESGLQLVLSIRAGGLNKDHFGTILWVCAYVCVCGASIVSNELLSALLYIGAYQYSDNSALTCSIHSLIVNKYPHLSNVSARSCPFLHWLSVLRVGQ